MESTTSYTFPVQTGGIFYWWDIFKGPTAYCVSSERHRYTMSKVENQVSTPNNTPGPGERTPTGRVTSGHANHYTTK